MMTNANNTQKETNKDPWGSPAKLEHDMNHVRQCIKRISFLDKTLVDRAMKETARNRKMNNLNNFENMTTG